MAQSRLHHHSRMNISASACCGDHPTADHQQSALSSGRRRPSASPSGIFVHHYPTHPARHHHGSSSSCLSPGLPFYGDGIGSVGDPYYHQHQQRPRQNSVVVFATAHFMTAARRVKSAMDLQTLVLREETEESVHALSCTAGGEASGLMGSSTADNHLAVGTITCVWALGSVSILFSVTCAVQHVQQISYSNLFWYSTILFHTFIICTIVIYCVIICRLADVKTYRLSQSMWNWNCFYSPCVFVFENVYRLGVDLYSYTFSLELARFSSSMLRYNIYAFSHQIVYSFGSAHRVLRYPWQPHWSLSRFEFKTYLLYCGFIYATWCYIKTEILYWK